MEEIENIIFKFIFKNSKFALAKELGMTRGTLNRRIEFGGWMKSEIEIIRNLKEKEVENERV